MFFLPQDLIEYIYELKYKLELKDVIEDLKSYHYNNKFDIAIRNLYKWAIKTDIRWYHINQQILHLVERLL